MTNRDQLYFALRHLVQLNQRLDAPCPPATAEEWAEAWANAEELMEEE